MFFISSQANRISDLILRKYDNHPDFPWSTYPNYGVFRNKETLKWYGLIMNIKRNKIGSGDDEISDEQIMEYVDMSYKFSLQK